MTPRSPMQQFQHVRKVCCLSMVTPVHDIFPWDSNPIHAHRASHHVLALKIYQNPYTNFYAETVLDVALRCPLARFPLVLPACLQATHECMIGVCSSAGCQWQNALEIFYMMPRLGLFADKITYSSVISALSKGKMWEKAMQVNFLTGSHKIYSSVAKLLLFEFKLSLLLIQFIRHFGFIRHFAKFFPFVLIRFSEDQN